MSTVVLGAGPSPLTVRFDRDVPTTLSATTSDGSAWATPVTLVFNDSAGTSLAATVNGNQATWALTSTQVNSLLGGLPLGAPKVRMLAGGNIVAAGTVTVGTGWTGDSSAQQTVIPVVAGPPGPPGPTNSLTIGAVTNVAAGGSPSASITGAAPNQVLNLGLVQGQPSAYELRGTGSPYGSVVPASAGIYYTDTAGTNGAWRWLSTGTTNTSWIVTVGDTGACDVSTLLYAGLAKTATYGECSLWRSGNVVFFRFRLNVTTSGSEILNLPSGFSADGVNGLTAPGVLLQASATDYASTPETPNYASYIGGNGRTLRGALSAPTTITGFWSWITSDPWPTSLPGVPA